MWHFNDWHKCVCVAKHELAHELGEVVDELLATTSAPAQDWPRAAQSNADVSHPSLTLRRNAPASIYAVDFGPRPSKSAVAGQATSGSRRSAEQAQSRRKTLFASPR